MVVFPYFSLHHFLWLVLPVYFFHMNFRVGFLMVFLDIVSSLLITLGRISDFFFKDKQGRAFQLTYVLCPSAV